MALEPRKAAAMFIRLCICFVLMCGEALACTCRPRDKILDTLTPEETTKYIYGKAEVVMLGTVKRVDVVTIPRGSGGEFALELHIDTQEIFKGPSTISRLYTGLDSAACQGPIWYGRIGTYFASRDREGRLWSDSCFWVTYMYGSNLGQDAWAVWRKLRDEVSNTGWSGRDVSAVR
jgi:hypothetical protein